MRCWLAVLLLTALLGGCGKPAVRQDAKAKPAPVAPLAVGRVGADGGALIADRGIGGTGAPLALSAASVTTDHGAGATEADRKTGVVGVITGFGSVFVDGMEIAYDDTTSVDIDGSATSASALRAGQVVVIRAIGPAAGLRGRMISVRSEVIGRIEGRDAGAGMLTIGGQAVAVTDGTWGGGRFGVGDWVKVSGLRRGDGVVVASRLDAAPAGTLLVHGQVVRDGPLVRVGSLALDPAVTASLKDRQFVIVTGRYIGGQAQAGTVAADTLETDAAAYFGESTGRFVIQAFVHVAKDSVTANGLKLPIADGAVGDPALSDAIAIVSVDCTADRSCIASDVRYTANPAPVEWVFSSKRN